MSEQNKDAELRQIVTDALVSMVSGVTGLVPPTGPGQIPDFIQAPIDRAVEKISASLPVGVPDGYALVPVEPTPEMRAEIMSGINHEHMVRNYKAMLAAAPTVKAEQVPDDQAYDRNAERLTAEALGTGAGINMAATSIDELFDEPDPSLPAAGSAVEGDAWLQEWARGKFTYTGRYKGQVYGNTDWALARALHADIVAALSAQQSAHVSVPREFGKFADKILAKLIRFADCAEDPDAGGVDIGRDWLNTLTHLGLLERVQRSPALWQTTDEADAIIEARRAILNGGEA